jgi:hypothetical protein
MKNKLQTYAANKNENCMAILETLAFSSSPISSTLPSFISFFLSFFFSSWCKNVLSLDMVVFVQQTDANAILQTKIFDPDTEKNAVLYNRQLPFIGSII